MEESLLLVEEFALDSFKPLDCDFDEVIFKDEKHGIEQRVQIDWEQSDQLLAAGRSDDWSGCKSNPFRCISDSWLNWRHLLPSLQHSSCLFPESDPPSLGDRLGNGKNKSANNDFKDEDETAAWYARDGSWWESTFYVSGFKMIQQWESGNLMRGYCERVDLVWFVLWTFTYIDPWLLNLLILLHLKVLLREVLGKIGVLSAIKTLWIYYGTMWFFPSDTSAIRIFRPISWALSNCWHPAPRKQTTGMKRRWSGMVCCSRHTAEAYAAWWRCSSFFAQIAISPSLAKSNDSDFTSLIKRWFEEGD